MFSFSREVGIVAVSCNALLALRMRVSMSAIGSVSISQTSTPISNPTRGKCEAFFTASLPGALGHAGDHARVGELPQADAAEPELLEDRARAPAPVAARVGANLVALRTGGLGDHRLLGHYSDSLLLSANGRPRPRSRARALSSSGADVVMAMSRPRTAATSS